MLRGVVDFHRLLKELCSRFRTSRQESQGQSTSAGLPHSIPTCPETVDESPEFSGRTQPVLSGTCGVHLTQGPFGMALALRGSASALALGLCVLVIKSLAFLATPAVAAPRLRAAQAGAFGAAALAAPLPAQAIEGVSTFELAFGGICLFFLIVVVVSDYLKAD
eukprot:s1142_g5.t1